MVLMVHIADGAPNEIISRSEKRAPGGNQSGNKAQAGNSKFSIF